MANFATSADLIDDILFRAGELTDGSSDFEAEALRLLNRAYRELYEGGAAFANDFQEDWLWLKKDPPGTLTILPVVNAGTVSVTKNSTSATLSVAQTDSMAGRFLRVEGHADTFRVSAHTGGTTALTLDSVYTGATNAAVTYKLMKLEYDLPSDVLRIVSPMRAQALDKAKIEGVHLNQMEHDWPLRDVESGVPTFFAPVTEAKIRFNRYGNSDPAGNFYRVEFDYLFRPADLLNDTGTPVVPLQYRHVLADMALTYLYATKNDDRFELVGNAAKSGIIAMANENRKRLQSMSRRFGKIRSRQDQLEKVTRPLRTESGIIIG